jgi:hypothetical protein
MVGLLKYNSNINILYKKSQYLNNNMKTIFWSSEEVKKCGFQIIQFKPKTK